MNDRSEELLTLLSAALDEVFWLRRALAYEAVVSEGHGDFKSFPKSRREILATQIERMREAITSGALPTYSGKAWRGVPDAPESLTIKQWADEVASNRPGLREGLPM